MSCQGWQHLWVSLVKFSDSVPLGITELNNLTSSRGSKSTVLAGQSPLKAGPQGSWARGAKHHSMTGGGMWVTEGSWDGPEQGACGQRSWCRQVVQARSCSNAAVQVGARVEHGGESGRTTQTLGVASALGNCIPFNLLLPFFFFFPPVIQGKC